MRCPRCGELETRVIDSRPTPDGVSIRRRRCCQQCSLRVTTYEIISLGPPPFSTLTKSLDAIADIAQRINTMAAHTLKLVADMKIIGGDIAAINRYTKFIEEELKDAESTEVQKVGGGLKETC